MLRYSAPEVFVHDEARGGAVYSDWADIFSAALVIWRLLTGRRPRARADPLERPKAGPARRRWPAPAALLERMWAHAPEERPSAGECAAAVRDMPVDAGCAGVVSGDAAACRTQ